jgi:hypothetical protein
MGACWAPWAYWGPKSFQAARNSLAPGNPWVRGVPLSPIVPGPLEVSGSSSVTRPNGFRRLPGVPRSTVGNELQMIPGPPGVFRDPGPIGNREPTGPLKIPGPPWGPKALRGLWIPMDLRVPRGPRTHMDRRTPMDPRAPRGPMAPRDTLTPRGPQGSPGL